jgi:hypothetical protein
MTPPPIPWQREPPRAPYERDAMIFLYSASV